MSSPRQISRGRIWMITRRCTQRQFILRPDDETNNSFAYCLAEAAERFQIDVVLPSVMSNHHHTIVYDAYGHIVDFIQHLHRHVAKSQNALRGRSENMWSSEELSLVELVDPGDVIAKLIYAATNPVKDGLVESVRHWPGFNGLSALLNQRPIETRRPKHFFRADGSMPERVTLNLVLPAALGDPEVVRRLLREAVAAVEEQMAAERALKGIRVMGRRAVLRQSWRSSPGTPEPRRRLRPRFAARDTATRVAIARRYRAFLNDYRKARALWLAGTTALFPSGTYWLHRFAGVPVAQPS